MENRPERKTRTGVVTIEWVDAWEPDDADAESNFGWSIRVDRPMDDARLRRLLLEIAESEHHSYK
jgi:hypothetical protein